MLRLRLLTVPLASLALLGVAGAASDPNTAITRAALAPYRDWLLRDAPALCADLTPSAAATIAPGAPHDASCEQVVQSIVAANAPRYIPSRLALALHATASHVTIDKPHATGVFSLTTSEVTEHRGTRAVKILLLGTYRLTLEELAGRWLVSSPARLVTIDDCDLNPSDRCARDLLLTLGEPLGGVPGTSIPMPAAVQRAAPRERHEFTAGRTVLLQTGCLACHRIDDTGNRGPGRNLTHIAARLPPRAIERVLLSPRAPMPSFKHLPAKKLRDLVRFLSLLR